MANCVDCSCKQVQIDRDVCKNLHELNDSRIKGGTQALKDAELCDYPKIFPKFLYGVWCVNKNMIALMCYVMNLVNSMVDKINELVDKVNELCKALQCVAELAKAKAEAELIDKYKNVVVRVQGRGSNDGFGTSTRVDSSGDGYTVTWTMNDGAPCGTGTIKGKYLTSYEGVDKDGNIKANLIGFTIDSVSYRTTGKPVLETRPATIEMFAPNGSKIFSKEYSCYTNWDITPNVRRVSINQSYVLRPHQNTPEVLFFKTKDTWVLSSTEGEFHGHIENRNDKITVPGCDIHCTPLEHLEVGNVL